MQSSPRSNYDYIGSLYKIFVVNEAWQQNACFAVSNGEQQGVSSPGALAYGGMSSGMRAFAGLVETVAAAGGTKAGYSADVRAINAVKTDGCLICLRQRTASFRIHTHVRNNNKRRKRQ